MTDEQILDILKCGTMRHLRTKQGDVYGDGTKSLTVNFCADKDVADACIKKEGSSYTLYYGERQRREGSCNSALRGYRDRRLVRLCQIHRFVSVSRVI